MIEDARRRQRRHWGLVAAAVVVAAAALGVSVYFGFNGGGSGARSLGTRSSARPSPSAREAAAMVFAREPDMGVACHVPNWIGCDRIGLAVWLRHSAVAVSATVAGLPMRLNDPTWSGPPRKGRRTMFAGFLQPAGITTRLHVNPEPFTDTWLGSGQPTPTVQFRIDYGRGKLVLTQESVGLRAGWG